MHPMRPLIFIPLLAVAACPRPGGGNSNRALQENEACAKALAEGKLDDAEIACDHGLEFDDRYADLWCNKGLIEKLRGNKQKAKDHFIHAIRLNQEHATAYMNLGVIYLEDENNPRDAKQQFERALKVNPDYAEALYNLALSQLALNERDGAKKTLRTLIHVHPQLSRPYVDLAAVFLQEKNAAEAEPLLQQAVGLNPKEPRAYLYLGVALHELGKNPEAKDAFSLCVDASPGDAEQCRQNLAALQ